MRLVLATANPHKADEIAAILGDTFSDIQLLARPDSVGEVEETEATLVGNARLKALALLGATGEAALADDTGLEVLALGGAPGVLSSRYAGPDAVDADNVAKLLGALRGVSDRRAEFRTVALVAFPDGSEVVAEGVVGGTIATEPRGEGGFGYDPVFVPDGCGGRSFAELSGADKNAVSHRGRAMRALAAKLAAGSRRS